MSNFQFVGGSGGSHQILFVRYGDRNFDLHRPTNEKDYIKEVFTEHFLDDRNIRVSRLSSQIVDDESWEAKCVRTACAEFIWEQKGISAMESSMAYLF